MNIEKVAAVKVELERMQRAINRLIATLGANNRNMYGKPRETGAVRRASMDLTRALADLRKAR